jgi:hypothetical protein
MEEKNNMDDKIYKITLANGIVIDDLSLNGNNYISSVEIDKSIFADNCSPVIISDGENEETHNAMELVHITKMGDNYWFALRDLTEAELEAIKNRSDIEYIALMCDVEL